ncbi:hypothetical protein NC651_039334 [Populus alba x Populus x berolinensis]|nr:hypothetical protein NC651_039334 [Populus alba x Populus x berolinensis]
MRRPPWEGDGGILRRKYFSKPLDRIILASFAYTGILNLIEMAGSYIPAFL